MAKRLPKDQELLTEIDEGMCKIWEANKMTINGVEVQLPSKERVETFILDYQCLLDNEFHSTYFDSVAKNEPVLTAVFSRLLDRFLFEDECWGVLSSTIEQGRGTP